MMCCAICFIHMSNQLQSSPNYPMCSKASSSKSFVWCWIGNIAEIAASLVVSDCHRVLMLWMQVFWIWIIRGPFCVQWLQLDQHVGCIEHSNNFSIQLFNTVTQRFYVALVGMHDFVVMEKGTAEETQLALCENDLWLPSTMFSLW
jgi:hypothetical protein